MARFTTGQVSTLSKAAEAAAVLDPEKFERLQAVLLAAKFSMRNLFCIFGQCPGATDVRGYRQWQAAGRMVSKGQKGIAILCPRFPAKDAEDQDPYFVVGYVFDVAQTEVLVVA